MRRSVIRSCSAAVVVMLAAACAGTRPSEGPRGSDAPGERLHIEVENDLIPSSPLIVYLLSDAGVRSPAGTVAPSRTVTLDVRLPYAGGRYRLLARTDPGREILSDPFSLAGHDHVTWSLRTNFVRVGSRSDP